MRDVKLILCLVPLLALAMVGMPTPGGVAVAQQDPAVEEAQATHVIELVKGSRVERVVVRSDGPVPAGEGPAAAGADELTRQIEVFKGGEVVVLTVVDRAPGTPIAARVDAAKNARGGPTSLLPVRLRPPGPALRRGPTSLLPDQPRAAEAALRPGPASLLPVEPPAAEAVVRDGATSLVPSRVSVAGATLQNRPAGGGVAVAAVEEGSPAWRDGLRQADVIESVYRTAVRDVAALQTALASAGSTAVLQVRRSGNAVIVVLRR